VQLDKKIAEWVDTGFTVPFQQPLDEGFRDAVRGCIASDTPTGEPLIESVAATQLIKALDAWLEAEG